MEYNLPRECIRNYFPSRRCFTFPVPTHPDNMSRLESLNPDELSREFLRVAEYFCKFVFMQSEVKLLKDGYEVNGKGELLGSLCCDALVNKVTVKGDNSNFNKHQVVYSLVILFKTNLSPNPILPLEYQWK